MKLHHLITLICIWIALLSFTIILEKEELQHPTSSLNSTVYFPLEIKDNAAASGNGAHTLIMMTGKTLDSIPIDCGLKFDFVNGVYKGRLVPLTATSKAQDFTLQLDTLKGYSDDSTVLFLIPQLQSGRAEVSINNPLCLTIVPDDSSGFTFKAPSINNTTDPNYNMIYDKFEFTYDANKNFFINPTAVDFFSIPIHINTLDNSQSSGAPLDKNRAELMTSIQATITKFDSTTLHSWDKCTIKESSTGTLIRIASPSLAPGFDTSYLSNTTTGEFNYIDNLIDYYRTKSLYIDCTQLNSKGFEIFDKYKVSPKVDPGAYYFKGTIGTSNPPVFTFVNSPRSSSKVMTHQIKMDSVISGDFFKPGTGQFATPNKSLESIIVENIVSGFSVGLLPAPDGDTFSNKIFPKEIHNYFKTNPLNASASVGKGPWYNLYSQAIHDAMGDRIYSFAYDDVLGMDGTLSTTNKDTIRVTIQDLGNVNIPNSGCLPEIMTIDASTIDVSTIKCGTDTCSITVNWTVPAGQPTNAKYFLMFGGQNAHFIVSPDDIVRKQVEDGLLTSKFHTSTLCFDKSSWLGSNFGTDIEIQVVTCGGVDSPCPTINNIGLRSKGHGSLLVAQTGRQIDPTGCTQ